MSNWYKISKQRVTILPRVRESMEAIDWFNEFVEALKNIKSIDKSGIYRISLGGSSGGRDFNFKVEVSPEEIKIVDVAPIDLEIPIRQLG